MNAFRALEKGIWNDEILDQVTGKVMLQKDSVGNSLFSLACYAGREEMALNLLNKFPMGTYLGEVNDFKETPLLLAIKAEMWKVVEILVTKEDANPCQMNEGHETALYLLVKKRKYDLAKTLYQTDPDCNINKTPYWGNLREEVWKNLVFVDREDILALMLEHGDYDHKFESKERAGVLNFMIRTMQYQLLSVVLQRRLVPEEEVFDLFPDQLKKKFHEFLTHEVEVEDVTI